MARSDLLLNLVEAERSGDRQRFLMVVESVIAEERKKLRLSGFPQAGLLMEFLMDGSAQGVIHRHGPARRIRESTLQRHFLAQTDTA